MKNYEEIYKGCGKKMKNSGNWRIEEHYNCGDTVQTGWGDGYHALCKECRDKLKSMKEKK